MSRLATKNSSVFPVSRNASPSSRRKASARSSPRYPVKPGAPCCKPSGQRYFWRSRTTSPLEPRAISAGREDRFKVSYNLSESGHDARVSLLTGKALSHRANITASKSYSTQTDFRFDMKTFMELRNAQAVTIAYDGSNPRPPMFCYLKPYYNDPNKSYFVQVAEGEL